MDSKQNRPLRRARDKPMKRARRVICTIAAVITVAYAPRDYNVAEILYGGEEVGSAGVVDEDPSHIISPVEQVSQKVHEPMDVYSSPDSKADKVGKLSPDETVVITGVVEGGSWKRILWSDTEIAFILVDHTPNGRGKEKVDCRKVLEGPRQIRGLGQRADALADVVRAVVDRSPSCAHEAALLIRGIALRDKMLAHISDHLLDIGDCDFAMRVAKGLTGMGSRDSQVAKISGVRLKIDSPCG